VKLFNLPEGRARPRRLRVDMTRLRQAKARIDEGLPFENDYALWHQFSFAVLFPEGIEGVDAHDLSIFLDGPDEESVSDDGPDEEEDEVSDDNSITLQEAVVVQPPVPKPRRPAPPPICTDPADQGRKR
jgi:hypothetical protein